MYKGLILELFLLYNFYSRRYRKVDFHILIFFILVFLVIVIGIFVIIMQFIANIWAKEFAKEMENLLDKYFQK